MLDTIRKFFTKPVAAPLPQFAVAMPEAGDGAFILMDMDALEKLQGQFGDDYFSLMETGFRTPSVVIISRALAICLHGAEPDGAPWGLSLEEIGRRLFDSQIRSWKGITLAEAEAAIAEAKS